MAKRDYLGNGRALLDLDFFGLQRDDLLVAPYDNGFTALLMPLERCGDSAVDCADDVVRRPRLSGAGKGLLFFGAWRHVAGSQLLPEAIIRHGHSAANVARRDSPTWAIGVIHEDP